MLMESGKCYVLLSTTDKIPTLPQELHYFDGSAICFFPQRQNPNIDKETSLFSRICSNTSTQFLVDQSTSEPLLFSHYLREPKKRRKLFLLILFFLHIANYLIFTRLNCRTFSFINPFYILLFSQSVYLNHWTLNL